MRNPSQETVKIATQLSKLKVGDCLPRRVGKSGCRAAYAEAVKLGFTVERTEHHIHKGRFEIKRVA